jgi:dTMP kinase
LILLNGRKGSGLEGIFITLEGVEGSGKTTAVAAVTEFFAKMGKDVVKTREPGGGKIASAIRAILLDPDNENLKPMAELFLYLADRAQHVQEMIRPALENGKVVICDRYADATVAYQGHARGLGVETVEILNRHATSGLEPHLTLLFDLPVEVGLARAKRRVEGLEEGAPTEDRFEREEVAFHERVRQGYLALAKKHPSRFAVLDATLDPAQVAAAATKALTARFGAKG